MIPGTDNLEFINVLFLQARNFSLLTTRLEFISLLIGAFIFQLTSTLAVKIVCRCTVECLSLNLHKRTNLSVLKNLSCVINSSTILVIEL